MSTCISALRTAPFALILLLTACPEPSEPDGPEPDADTDTDTDADTDVDLPDDPMPLVGTWVDSWDGAHLIDEARWAMGDSVFHLGAVDATEGWATAMNDTDNQWNPGFWSRFDWVPASPHGWWFCQSVFDADSEDDARFAPKPNSADPAQSGCGGFAWSRLYTPLPIRGAWIDNWGGDHDIREWAWTSGSSRYHVADYNPEAGWIIAQNDEGNLWNPGLWSRFEWTEHSGGWWFCQIAFAAETEQAARDAGPADATDPSTGGCGGFAWSALSSPD